MRPRSESVTRKAGDRDPVANPPACPGSTCSLGPVTVKVTVDPGISWLAGLGRFSSQLVAARAPAPPGPPWFGVSSSDSESGSWARSACSLKWETLEATRRPTVTRFRDAMKDTVTR
jgi:hypothetical protein